MNRGEISVRVHTDDEIITTMPLIRGFWGKPQAEADFGCSYYALLFHFLNCALK